MDVYACVVMPSILEASLHRSVYVGASAGFPQEESQHKSVVNLIVVLHLPCVAVAFVFHRERGRCGLMGGRDGGWG